jgi:hypothetical protein
MSHVSAVFIICKPLCDVLKIRVLMKEINAPADGQNWVELGGLGLWPWKGDFWKCSNLSVALQKLTKPSVTLNYVMQSSLNA